jgi:hypothetical protein
MITLTSNDTFGEADDPHQHIATAMTQTVMSRFKAAGIPPRSLELLKVGDVCIILLTKSVDERWTAKQCKSSHFKNLSLLHTSSDFRG